MNGSVTPDVAARSAPPLIASLPGKVVLAVLVAWFAIALVRPPADAQDAVPLVVAGELATSDPGQVYVERDGSLFDLRPAFENRSCEIIEPHLVCERHAVAFVSPPAALPLVTALSWLGPELAIRTVRILAVAALAVGVIALWRRLAGSSAQAPSVIAASVVLMTPLAMISIGLGQTTPFMFAAVALGVAGSDRSARGRAAVVAVWAVTVTFKAVTALVGLVLLWQRRWALLSWAAAVLGVLTLGGIALGQPSIIGQFLTGTSAVSLQATVNPYNGSVEAALYHLPFVSVDEPAADAVGMALRVLVLGVAVWMFRGIRDHDVQWAFAWTVLLVLTPLVWWHYSIVLVGAVGVAIARSAEPARWIGIIPAMLLIGMPMSVANNRGWSMPTAQWLFALACVGLVWWLGSRHARTAAEVV